MVRTVFNKIDNSSENIEFTVKVSMLEIYLENVKDLLNPIKDRLVIKQDPKLGIFIPDMTEKYISCPEEVYQIMAEGNSNRAVSSTQMNDKSSRSHSIFVITIS
jgi:kinesin family protein 5